MNKTNQSATLPSLKQPKSISKWHFILPLLFQLGLVGYIPSQAFYTFTTGKTVVLQTVPVDPYDFLRGYSQTLRYNISSTSDLEQLPGWDEILEQTESTNSRLARGTRLYVILESPSDSNAVTPQPWQPVGVSLTYPDRLADNQIALTGRVEGSLVEYGLETYYMPENQREDINNTIGDRQADRQAFVVEVKIDSRGKSVPVSLWIGEERYRF